jgi:hypothetical protein
MDIQVAACLIPANYWESISSVQFSSVHLGGVAPQGARVANQHRRDQPAVAAAPDEGTAVGVAALKPLGPKPLRAVRLSNLVRIPQSRHVAPDPPVIASARAGVKLWMAELLKPRRRPQENRAPGWQLAVVHVHHLGHGLAEACLHGDRQLGRARSHRRQERVGVIRGTRVEVRGGDLYTILLLEGHGHVQGADAAIVCRHSSPP